jgi:hypothetical protein
MFRHAVSQQYVQIFGVRAVNFMLAMSSKQQFVAQRNYKQKLRASRNERRSPRLFSDTFVG